MVSHQSHWNGGNPPLPHHAQSHFYGAPDIDFGLGHIIKGMLPGDKGYYCGFDNMPSVPGGRRSDRVLVMGYEGGLRISRVHGSGLSELYALDQIRGGVYGAKVLPWTAVDDFSREFAMVALVVHGPALVSDRRERSPSSSGSPSEASAVPTDSPQNSPQSYPHFGTASNPSYQTSVQIYALHNKSHIATLLLTPSVIVTGSTSHSPLVRPPPVGDLSIRADGLNIVVCSNVSGEVFIFDALPAPRKPIFRCLGKIWTNVHHRLEADSVSSASSTDGESQYGESHGGGAVFAIKGRWFAYSPIPSGAAQTSLKAYVPGLRSSMRIPGLPTRAAPHPPAINCSVESPEGAGMLNRVAWDVTQRALKAGNYVAGQGMQIISNYWSGNKAATAPTSTGGTNNFGQMYPGVYTAQPQYVQQGLPPTHAPETSTEPSLVSIIDLEDLAATRGVSSASPQPFITFRASRGCSFLSFSPTGLMLFTASTKGDSQHIWDLLRMKHTKSSTLQGHPGNPDRASPRVRQVAEFSRLSSARIVDVIWTSPQGERLAMVTEHGTAHILDLPASAFLWPPLRTALKRTSDKDDSSGSQSAAATILGATSNVLSAGWNMGNRFTRASNPRRISGSGLPTTSMANGIRQGGKAFISKSYGAASGTFNGIIKGHENKVFLPRGGPSLPGPACVTWLGGASGYSMAVFGNSVVRIYKLKQRKNARPDQSSLVVGSKDMKDFKLPLLPDPKIAAATYHTIQPDSSGETEDVETTVQQLDAYRNLRSSPQRLSGTESSIPQAEIDSNAPYQPFHTDPRVGLHVYSSQQNTSSSVSASPLRDTKKTQPNTILDDETWVFGLPISTVKLDVGTPEPANDDHDLALAYGTIERRTLHQEGGFNDEGERIVVTSVTTRRCKGSAPLHGDDTDEGAFEDEYEFVDYANRRV
jgi:hypothetical protein